MCPHFNEELIESKANLSPPGAPVTATSASAMRHSLLYFHRPQSLLACEEILARRRPSTVGGDVVLPSVEQVSLRPPHGTERKQIEKFENQ